MEATKETLTEYFSQYGAVADSIIMIDNITSRSRGFGFVTFVDASTVTKVLNEPKHVINGKAVDAKKAVPKGPNQSNILKAMGITSNRADKNPDCKVFVGGVAQGTTETDLETYFREFGNVLEVKIPKDQNTQRARGFSFVLFDTPESVAAATQDRYHRINGKTVEVKTVHLHPHKGHHHQHSADSSDDGQLQNPTSPYMVNQRSGYYGNYHPQGGYMGMGPPGYYNHTAYEPSQSGSTGSAASLESSGYGGLSSPNPRGQGLENYSYMAMLYPQMAELSISQRYPGMKGFGPLRAHYQIPSSQVGSPYTPSGATASYNEYQQTSPYNPNFAALSNVAASGSGMSLASFPSTSTPQPGTNPTFSR